MSFRYAYVCVYMFVFPFNIFSAILTDELKLLVVLTLQEWILKVESLEGVRCYYAAYLVFCFTCIVKFLLILNTLDMIIFFFENKYGIFFPNF